MCADTPRHCQRVARSRVRPEAPFAPAQPFSFRRGRCLAGAAVLHPARPFSLRRGRLPSGAAVLFPARPLSFRRGRSPSGAAVILSARPLSMRLFGAARGSPAVRPEVPFAPRSAGPCRPKPPTIAIALAELIAGFPGRRMTSPLRGPRFPGREARGSVCPAVSGAVQAKTSNHCHCVDRNYCRLSGAAPGLSQFVVR